MKHSERFLMDKELVLKLKNGENEAYKQLISMYSKRLYYLCLKMLGSELDAEDAVQTTFFKVFKAINKFEERSGLTTWIYRIAVNTCNDILRKRKRDCLVSQHTVNDEQTEDFYSYISDDSENIEEKILRRENERIIYECIYKLPYLQRRFIVLRDLEGLSYAQIAGILDLNIGTVKSGINRARSKLIKLIKEYED